MQELGTVYSNQSLNIREPTLAKNDESVVRLNRPYGIEATIFMGLSISLVDRRLPFETSTIPQKRTVHVSHRSPAKLNTMLYPLTP